MGLGILATSPLILLCWLETLLCRGKGERIYSQCKELVATVPTIVGQYLRLGFYYVVCERISPDVSFLLGSMVAHRATTIGAHTVVGAYSIVGCADIEENVLIGSRVSLLSGKYQHGTPEERANGQTTNDTYQRIHVGRGSWIGEQAVVLANVGENCTVGAGSVVLRDTVDNATYMGNPARKVSL
ncbi:MAG TPA: acyltransferase [candidate division Zixibacteria bacterium]|nr:acyltransferase [candidate division Zixibacteria bacterium]